jgi:hypothetical protein
MTKDEWAAERRMTPVRRRSSPSPLKPVVDALPRSIADHVSRWRTDDGGWALVFQPYHFTLKHMRRLIEVCDRQGVEAEVDPLANWHHPDVVGIVVRTPPA